MTGSPYSRILSWVDSSYWLMHPPAFESMRAIIASWSQAPHALPRLSPEQRAEAIQSAQMTRTPPQTYQAPSTIAVINMFGVISPRSGMIDDWSQEGCSLDTWGSKYQSLMMDSNVAGVLINGDSPGGNVYQVEETANLIYSLRDLKPNVCVVTGMGASAGFYLMTQFKELVCSPSAEVGSIGVLMRHQDVSKMADDLGVKNTYITSPRDGNKAEGNPFTPLSDDTVEFYNSRTDEYYDMFLNALARGRGITGKSAKTQIDQDWGRGRMVGASTALKLGMVDRVGTIQSEIDRMVGGLKKSGQGGGKRAANDEGDRVRAQAKLRLA